MNWRDINILYQRELRSALRERSIVINSILLPIFLYPVMLWLMFSGMTLVQGLTEGFVSRVVIEGLPARHAAVRDTLAGMDNVELRELTGTVDSAVALVRAGELDAVVEVLPARAGGPVDNFRVRITYDQSEERSQRARERVSTVIDRYRDRLIEEQARALGLGREQLEPFQVQLSNVASGGEIGAFLLAQMLPVFLVIMVALGCFYPAIDATAGERERSTWETLMTVSASRGSVVSAKYLYVATLGTVAALLNVAAMVASVGGVLAPLLRDRGQALEFSLPWLAIPVMAGGAVTLALFFAAAMMILASFARTFKDGQAMVTPIYYLALLPVFIVNQPDQSLTVQSALIPVANVILMSKDAIRGIFHWDLVAITLAVELATVVACLWAARLILGFEDLLLGSYDGSFFKFMKERVFNRGAAAPGGAA